jgi:hypothetical protein
MDRTALTRRRALTCAGAVIAGLAGCAGDGGGGGERPSASGTDGAEPTTASTDLDLREANVVDVTVESEGGSDEYRFDVTLIHDDEGEDGYADWWQVETLDGERLGRRGLAHPHGTREFTRSTTVSVPDGTACVVVRGHDRTHGYGGRAMLVGVETGATTPVRQGPARQSVADRGC